MPLILKKIVKPQSAPRGWISPPAATSGISPQIPSPWAQHLQFSPGLSTAVSRPAPSSVPAILTSWLASLEGPQVNTGGSLVYQAYLQSSVWPCLPDGPQTGVMGSLTSGPISWPASCWSWLGSQNWTLDLPRHLSFSGIVDGICYCHQPGPAEVLWDCALVGDSTAWSVLGSPSAPASFVLRSSPTMLIPHQEINI